MIKIPYEDILRKINSATGLSEAEIEEKIKAKLLQLSGLVSREGAAHIIANELGVKLFEVVSGRLEVKNILAGMRNVETVGRVTNVYEEREFQTENRSGRVGSFILGDTSGTIRIVCWGDQCNNLRKLKQNDIVRISSGYVKENIGRKEVHLNDKSGFVINPAGIDVPMIGRGSAIRKQIKDLKSDDGDVELLATIVQVFEPKFFEVCPVCNKRAKPKDDKFECPVHGLVNPDFSYVVNCFIDDGTDNIRATFFRDQAEQLTGKNKVSMVFFRDNMDSFNEVKNELLGKMVMMKGRVKNNEMFDRLELIVNDINLNPDPNQELEKLRGKVEQSNKNMISATEEDIIE